MALGGAPLGSEVDRLNGGLASSVEGVPGDDSSAADPSEALTISGMGAFFLRSNKGLIGLISSGDRP